MRRKSTIALVAILAIISAGLFLSCSKKESPAGSLSGTIRISGAWALYPMMVRWGEEFHKIHPDVRIDVSAGGAGKGVTDALSGLVDIGMVSREIRQEEIDKGAFFVPVVKDAVFPSVNENNPVAESLSKTGLKKQMFVDLWINGKEATWGGLTGAVSNDKVNVYTRSDSCGAAETWAKYLGGSQEDLKGVGVYGDPGVAEAVKKDPLGIGYNNLNYAFDAKTQKATAGCMVVPIDVNENGKIDIEEDISTKEKAIIAIQNGVYPSPPARDLYVITKTKFSSLAKEFMLWILTEGQQYVDEVGYIRLTDSQLKEAMDKVKE